MAAYAIFIGNDKYDDGQIQDLRCARRDAQELYGLFSHRLGYDERAQLLPEGIGPAGVVEHVEALRRLVQPGDSFLFYFAGHGAEATASDDQFLLLSEARLGLLQPGVTTTPVGVLSVSLLLGLTDTWAGVDRVFVFDACRTAIETTRGGSPAISFGAEQTLDKLVSRRINPASTPLISRPDGMLAREARTPKVGKPPVFIKSCRSGQTALEMAESGRGLFSKALHEVLRDASVSGEASIASAGLIDVVGTRMAQIADGAGLSLRQEPWISANAQPVVIAPGREETLHTPGPAPGGVVSAAPSGSHPDPSVSARRATATVKVPPGQVHPQEVPAPHGRPGPCHHAHRPGGVQGRRGIAVACVLAIVVLSAGAFFALRNELAPGVDLAVRVAAPPPAEPALHETVPEPVVTTPALTVGTGTSGSLPPPAAGLESQEKQTLPSVTTTPLKSRTRPAVTAAPEKGGATAECKELTALAVRSSLSDEQHDRLRKACNQ